METTWQPEWWNDSHRTAWERVKEALRRDWEQTKSDLHVGGTDLDQSVGDTVKQATGSEPLPSTRGLDDWARVENGLRYGYAARAQYGREHADWNDRLEAKLEEEWRDLKSGQTWDEIKGSVRHGWERARPGAGPR